MSYRIEHRIVNDIHVFTSPDVPGLYVANPVREIAEQQIPEAVEAIRRINARAKERAELETKFA